MRLLSSCVLLAMLCLILCCKDTRPVQAIDLGTFVCDAKAKALDEQPVSAAGNVEPALILFCKNGKCGVLLRHTQGNPDRYLYVDLRTGTGSTEMEILPEDYKSEDLKFRDSQGVVRGIADRVRITGIFAYRPPFNEAPASCTIAAVRTIEKAD